jgi:hypothetical protein
MTITFTQAELDVLRAIINDWIGQDLLTPPYSTDHLTVFEKLGVEIPEPDLGLIPPLRPNLG